MRFSLLKILIIAIVVFRVSNALPQTGIYNYSIFDSAGNLLSAGIPDGCWSYNGNDVVYRNLSAGDNFTIVVNITNIAPPGNPDNNVRFYVDIISDREYRADICSGDCNKQICGDSDVPDCPFYNFTYYDIRYGNNLQVPAESTTLAYQYLSSRPLLAGKYYIMIRVDGDGNNNLCTRLKLDVNSSQYYKVISPNITNEFGNLRIFNITNYAPTAYNSATGQWAINYTNTFINIGTIDAYFDYTELCNQHYSNGTAILRKELNCIPSYTINNFHLAPGANITFTCALQNVTNTTGTWSGADACEWGLTCWPRINKTATYHYNFGAVGGAEHYGYIGYTPCPVDMSLSWAPYIAKPWLGSLFVVPGVPFNISTWLGNHYSNGNYSVDDNLNISTVILDNTFSPVYANWRWMLPEGNITNVTVPWNIWRGYLLYMNITSLVPQGVPLPPSSNYTWTDLKPSKHLVDTARAAGQSQYVVWSDQCPPGGWRDLLYNTTFCHWSSDFGVLRMIYIDNTPQLIEKYVMPGMIFDYNYTVNNPFENSTWFALEKYPDRLSPVILSFNPDPIQVPRAVLTPGQANGILTVNTPLGTNLGDYRFRIVARPAINPSAWDFIDLLLHVVANDVEVVSINATPEYFIYDPESTNIVNISVVVRNNVNNLANVSLNASVNSSIQQMVFLCNGGNTFQLAGYETKSINCGYANIPPYTYENAVVRADIALLNAVDTIPQNNHKLKILSVISRAAEPVAVPEFSPWLISIMAALIIAISRRRK